MKIKVAQEHIEKGKAKNCAWCPVALAVREMNEHWSLTYVNQKDIEIYMIDGRLLTAETPKSAQEFIFAFDNDKPVEPFEFELEINQ